MQQESDDQSADNKRYSLRHTHIAQHVSRLRWDHCINSPAEQVATPAFDERLRKVLLQTFRPAFLARMTVVPYRPLEEATLEGIVVAKLEKLRERYKAATGKQFDFDPAIVKAVLAKCSAAGARDIENVLMAQVTGKLAEWVLE